MDSKKRRPSAAAALIGLGGPHVNKDILRERYADRDQRAASDTRTDAQRWLGDPPPSRSALASHTQKPR